MMWIKNQYETSIVDIITNKSIIIEEIDEDLNCIVYMPNIDDGSKFTLGYYKTLEEAQNALKQLLDWIIEHGNSGFEMPKEVDV